MWTLKQIIPDNNYFYNSYPRIVEGDPVFDSIAKSLKAQIGKIVEEIDHTVILPTSIFLLQNLKKTQIGF